MRMGRKDRPSFQATRFGLCNRLEPAAAEHQLLCIQHMKFSRTLLLSCCWLFTGNANAHHARNLPVFLAGGGFPHGRYVAHDNAPLCNLFVTMLNHAGLKTESFGQSNAALSW